MPNTISGSIHQFSDDDLLSEILSLHNTKKREEGIYDMSEADTMSEGRVKYLENTKKYYRLLRYGNIPFMEKLLIQKANPPWFAFEWIEHLTETGRDTLLHILQIYLRENEQAIYESHVQCAEVVHYISRIHLFPLLRGYLMDVVECIPERLAYQIFSLPLHVFDYTVAKHLALRVFKIYSQKNLTQKQELGFLLQAIRHGVWNDIFITEEEKRNALEFIHTVHPLYGSSLGIQRNTLGKMVLGNQLPLLSQSGNDQYRIDSKIVNGSSVALADSLQETILVEVPSCIQIVFGKGKGMKESYQSCMRVLQEQCHTSRDTAYGQVLYVGNTEIHINNPNICDEKMFIQEYSLERIDMLVIRGHTGIIESIQEYVANCCAKVVYFGGCDGVKVVMQELLLGRMLLGKPLPESEKIYVATDEIGTTKKNNEFLSNVICQIQTRVMLDILSIIPDGYKAMRFLGYNIQQKME